MYYGPEVIARDGHKLGFEMYYCGGCARDKIRNVTPRDIDIEVYGVTYDSLIRFLSQYGKADEIGKSFGIVKFKGDFEADFSLPRRESKTGTKHTSFTVYSDLFMPKAEACSRRDFTINSILIDVLTDEVFDYYGGIQDLKDGVLRATSNAFGDDVLRVLRGFGFSSRFNLKVEPRTAELCRSLHDQYSSIPLDRVWMEYYKFLTLSETPSLGLQFLIDVGWSSLYPQIFNMIGCLQNPKWHREKDTFEHTCMVSDQCVRIAKRENLSEEDRLILILAGILHDCAKPKTSIGEYPEISSPRHAEEGVPIATEFLNNIKCPEKIINRVRPLVKNHMRYLNTYTIKAVRKLAVDMEPSNISELCLLIEADNDGRIPKQEFPEKAQNMLDISKKENVLLKKQKKIVDGQLLKSLSIKAGPIYGEIINKAYKAQMDNKFNEIEGAKIWLRKNMNYILEQDKIN